MPRPSSPCSDIAATLIEFQGRIASKLAGPSVLHEEKSMAKHIIEDILVLLFLYDSGLVRDPSGAISAADFLTGTLTSRSSALERIQASISSLSAGVWVKPITVPGECTLGHKEPGLFHGTLSDPAVFGALDDDDLWHGILRYFNEFRWVINESHVTRDERPPTITPAILSRFHEHDMAKEGAAGLKKRTGSYYTPPNIARYISTRCTTLFLASKMPHGAKISEDHVDYLEESDPATAQEEIGRLKVLDPSCGSGEFLVAIADAIFTLRSRLGDKFPGKVNVDAWSMKYDILSNNIFGVDLSNDAIDVAKKRLWLWMLSGHGRRTSTEHVLPRLDANIVPGNALIGWLDEEIPDTACDGQMHETGGVCQHHTITRRLSRALESNIRSDARGRIDLEPYHPTHWRLVFRELIEKEGGFDIVVGNPPFLFVRGNNFDDIERAYYSTWYFQGYTAWTKGKARQSGKLNAFSLFIVRSIKLLKKGGILGFIVPNTILRTTTNDVTRQFITESTIIHEIVDLQDGVFEGVVASTVVLILEKGANATRRTSTIIKHCVEDILAGKFKVHTVEQSRFSTNNACIFDIHVDGHFKALFSTMLHDAQPLMDICSEIIEGLVTRRGDNLFTTDPRKQNAKKLLRGKNIDRYSIDWPEGQYIIFDPSALHRPRPVRVHEAPVKLLAQRIGGGTYPLRVAYDERQFYFFASINAIVLKDDEDQGDINGKYKYILAILNSTLMNAYYLLNFSNKSALTVNVGKTFIGSIPIKNAPPALRECIIRIVDGILFLKERAMDERGLLEFLDKEVLDALIFDLYTVSDRDAAGYSSILRFLQEIDLETTDVESTIAAMKETHVRIKEDYECVAWLKKVHGSVDFKAIKGLFEDRPDSLVD